MKNKTMKSWKLFLVCCFVPAGFLFSAAPVSTATDLETAIINANAGGDTTIQFTADITIGSLPDLAPFLRPLNTQPDFQPVDHLVKIHGNGHTLSGGGTIRGFFARGGTAGDFAYFWGCCCMALALTTQPSATGQRFSGRAHLPHPNGDKDREPIMQVAPEIVFNHMPKTAWIEDYVRQRIERIDRIAEDVIACRVAVERDQHHRNTGNPYRVRVEVTIPPRKELIADKAGIVADPQAQLRPVIRTAFEAIEKQLRKEQAKRRGDVKLHAEEPRGVVVEIDHEAGYGVLEDFIGTTYFFNSGAVLHGDFERLTNGTEVRFEPDPGNETGETELGDEGLRASTVQIVSKPTPNLASPE
jgi:ribosome-associated translation inhibitor RaiA